jgi:hypothetical protein
MAHEPYDRKKIGYYFFSKINLKQGYYHYVNCYP